jgi:hypothetical protein
MGKWLWLALALSLLVPISGQDISSDNYTDLATVAVYTPEIHPYAPGIQVTLGDGWETVAELDGLELDETSRPPRIIAVPAAPRHLLLRPMEAWRSVTLPHQPQLVQVFGDGRLLFEGEHYRRDNAEIIMLGPVGSRVDVYYW